MSTRLLQMLDRLDSLIPDAPHWTGIGVARHDWRPIWELAKEIQLAFNAGPRFPSKEERQAAWLRFNQLRDRASATVNAERAALRDRSAKHRDNILYMCKGIEYSAVTDALFFFDPTTADQVKRWGRYLGDAMKALSEHKGEMLAEHKQVCFERFQEIKESHDRFWSDYKSAHAARRERHLERRAELISKANQNRAANRERLAKAQSALERQRHRIAELRDKVDESTSAKWRAIHESWLEEAEAKYEQIQATIQRIEEWIGEDDRRLDDLNR